MKNYISLIAGIIFISLSCVSLDKTKEASKESILNSQKAFVLSLINSGSPQKAMSQLDSLITQNPNDSELHNLMGLTHISLKNTDTAIFYLKKSNRLKPLISTSLNLSSAFIEKKKYVSAIKLLKKQLKLKSFKSYKYPERVFHNIGVAYSHLKRDKIALRYYKKSLEHNPAYVLTLTESAHIYAKHKRHKRAEKNYQKAVQYCRRCFNAHLNLSRFYYRAGQLRKANAAASRYLRLPDLTQKDAIRGRKELSKYQLQNRPSKKRVKNRNNYRSIK